MLKSGVNTILSISSISFLLVTKSKESLRQELLKSRLSSLNFNPFSCAAPHLSYILSRHTSKLCTELSYKSRLVFNILKYLWKLLELLVSTHKFSISSPVKSIDTTCSSPSITYDGSPSNNRLEVCLNCWRNPL